MRQSRPSRLQRFLHTLFVVLFVLTPLLGFLSAPVPAKAQGPALPPIPFPTTVPLEDLLPPDDTVDVPPAPEVQLYAPPTTGGFVPPIGETVPYTGTASVQSMAPITLTLSSRLPATGNAPNFVLDWQIEGLEDGAPAGAEVQLEVQFGPDAAPEGVGPLL